MGRLAVGFALSVLALSTPSLADDRTPDRTSATLPAKPTPLKGGGRSRALSSASVASPAMSAEQRNAVVAHRRPRAHAKLPAKGGTAPPASPAMASKGPTPAGPFARHDIPRMQHATTPEMDMGEVEMEEKGHIGAVPAVQPARRR